MTASPLAAPSLVVPAATAPGAGSRLRAWLPRGRSLVVAAPFLWLLAFFLVPFAIVAKISVSEVATAIPPYAALLDWTEDAVLTLRLDFANYLALFTDELYWRSYVGSVRIAAVSTLITLVIAFPMAYAMAKAPRHWRSALMALVILPFWTSFLIRVYAWIGILKPEGLLNALLMGLGVIDTPLAILNTETAVYVGIVYSYLPFMILPIYSSLEKLDLRLLEAAADLGCHPAKAFWVITVPLALPGVIAGAFLVFIPAIGEFVIPDLLGGSDTLMIGKTLWAEFFGNRDWPLAAAVAVVLVAILVIPIMLFQRSQKDALVH